jgi:UDP-N-acetylglucosamine acyltransferase
LPQVHPSSQVDPQAELADDVVIGPGCVLEGPVRVGAGTRLIGAVWLAGTVTIGRDNVLYPQTCIGFEPQDRKDRGATAGVAIGDRNVLREGVTIHRSTDATRPTRIGHDNYLMTHSHLAHDVALHDRVILASGAMVGGHAEVFDGVNLGGGSAVHQHARLGRLAFVGGLGAVSRDLPPFCLAGRDRVVNGLNRVGLRRAGIGRPAIDRLRKAFDVLYRQRHALPRAIELLEDDAAAGGDGADLVTEMVGFLRESRRGIAAYCHAAEPA